MQQRQTVDKLMSCTSFFVQPTVVQTYTRQKFHQNSVIETDAKKVPIIKIYNFDPIIVKPCQNDQLMSR